MLSPGDAVPLLVVVVNFRVPSLVIDCLRSIAPELPSVPTMRVVVVENGSGDDSAARIGSTIASEGWSAWCRLIVSFENLGFTGGNNLPIIEALRSAEPPKYVLLLNPDTVVRSGALGALVEFMDQHPAVGIAGSRLEDPDGTPQRSAFRFKTPLGEIEAYARVGALTRLLSDYVVAPPVVDHPTKTDWVAGASMIVRREVFAHAGLLDEGFFTYYDDIDFCLAAGRSGWQTWYVPQSRIVHLVGQSTGVNSNPRRLPPYMLEARRRFFVKNYPNSYAILIDACMLLGISISRLRACLSRKCDLSPPYLLSDSFRHSVFVRGFKVVNVQRPGQ